MYEEIVIWDVCVCVCVCVCMCVSRKGVTYTYDRRINIHTHMTGERKKEGRFKLLRYTKHYPPTHSEIHPNMAAAGHKIIIPKPKFTKLVTTKNQK